MVRGPGHFLRLGANAELVGEAVRGISENASLELDQDAKLDGQEVKLNCKGAQATAAGKRIPWADSGREQVPHGPPDPVPDPTRPAARHRIRSGV